MANAFLTTEDTIAKRIYPRKREKIKQENIKLDPPGIYEMPARLDSVLHVLYLLFNEGYHSSHGDTVIREDLCTEAMRLTYLLVQHKSTSFTKSKRITCVDVFAILTVCFTYGQSWSGYTLRGSGSHKME
ncbi:MAG: DUF6596 domain-containing protein [Cytophagales bacterium]|nr:DUF6596 domain-containing protein [Cytophagales bacterium]